MGSGLRSSLAERVVAAFSEWFESAICVWQTLAFCLGVLAIEAIWPHLDPNHFGYLLVLTVYSGVTQPALAYSARRAGNLVLRAIQGIDEVVDNVQMLVRNSADSLEAQYQMGIQIKEIALRNEAAVEELKAEMQHYQKVAEQHLIEHQKMTEENMRLLREELARHHRIDT